MEPAGSVDTTWSPFSSRGQRSGEVQANKTVVLGKVTFCLHFLGPFQGAFGRSYCESGVVELVRIGFCSDHNLLAFLYLLYCSVYVLLWRWCWCKLSVS